MPGSRSGGIGIVFAITWLLSWSSADLLGRSSSSFPTVKVVHPFLHHESVVSGLGPVMFANGDRTRLRLFNPNESDAVAIVGDFNTLPPSEVYLGIEAAPRSMTTRLRGVNGSIDHGPVELLLRNGFRDICGSDRVATYPTPLAGRADADTLNMRVDYLLATETVALRLRCAALDFSRAATASDHLPVIGDFDVSDPNALML